MSQNRISNDYWQQFELVGEISFPPSDHAHELYLKVHTGSEMYASEVELGFELSEPQGERIYVHCRPCILEPHVMLTFTLTGAADQATIGQSLGKVVESRVDGMHQRVIGNAQGWYYPADRILVLWEYEVFFPYGTAPEDPSEDCILFTVWEAFERMLLNKFTEVRQIVTPGWEPKYQDKQWKSFLQGRGYIPLADDQRAFTKPGVWMNV